MFNKEITNDINPFVCWCHKTDPSLCSPPGTIGPERRTKTFELEFVDYTDGGGEISGGIRRDNKKGDLIFRKPGVTTRWVSLSYSYVILFFLVENGSDIILNPSSHLEDAERYKKEVCRRDSGFEKRRSVNDFPIDFPRLMNVSKFAQFKELFELSYREYLKEREQTQLFLKTYLLQIFSMMYTELSITNLQQNPSRSIRTNYQSILGAKQYIDNNLKLRFKLNDLAAYAGLSPNFFCKIFKDIIGCSPIDYINKSRINAVKNALLTTNSEIKEIYKEYGYEDHAYFYTLFKKIQGTTPSAFRAAFQDPWKINP